MSSYPHSSLLPEGDNIRLLCLFPNEYEAAPIQCALRNYSLPKLDIRTHLYEALSYAWGNPDETLPICVDGGQFPVTVLQEVAAARHIVMICGSIEIDGHAFCSGLKSLKLSYTASPELQNLPSVTYLIERAGLRSKYTKNSPERFSLEIRRLAELVDMFHTRKASDVRDKVYALLGMSSDDPGEAGLRPDYEVSWKELFQKLVKFVLGKDLSVETSDYSQRAVIKSKGCMLGQVSSVRSDDRQNTLHASAKSIREHDIVCLLQGALKPTIIRLCKDHFIVVVIAVTPLNESGSLRQLELSKSITHFPRNFLLVWDLEKPLGRLQDREEYETLIKTNSQVPEYSKIELEGYLEKPTRIWDVALVLGDLEEYKEAEEKLREAIKGYKIAIREEYPRTLKNRYGLTPLSWAARNGYDAVVKLLLAKDSVDPDLKDSQYGQTPLSWAAEGGHDAIVKLLLEIRRPREGHEAIVKLLLETRKVKVDLKDWYDRTPLSWAAKGGHEDIVKLLLSIGKVEIQTTLGRIHSFGPYILPQLVMRNRYKWILLDRPGSIAGFYFEKPMASPVIMRLGVGRDGSSESREPRKLQYLACDAPYLPLPIAWWFSKFDDMVCHWEGESLVIPEESMAELK
ncbi:hypothetical protein G7Y89_g13046 [Cudoniella acicularis]|uniref:Uncharacterized protein n=1 Tax=Cudoniella acicularis TaxID=354080 RepID=A0A8H4VWE8_9HELO|nr:hypothetical protein G7Y89_g13046 [Cudoniella acicularis]